MGRDFYFLPLKHCLQINYPHTVTTLLQNTFNMTHRLSLTMVISEKMASGNFRCKEIEILHREEKHLFIVQTTIWGDCNAEVEW